MTPERFETSKAEYLDNIKAFANTNNGLKPMLTIIADIKNPTPDQESKSAIVHISIPGDIMNSENGKEYFIQAMLPNIAKEIKEKFTAVAIGWACEAWMRKSEEGVTEIPDNWKELPKEEIVICTIESSEETNSYLYNIKRTKVPSVNFVGELVDQSVELELIKTDDAAKISGRFSNLLKIFQD